ncbi:hypothetical protein IPL85_02075 [Candidatus Saccharibacteria bacterium]|nr:MAG: hypothetical protein IPL85_02075 [Candidatus Saccharibacteria bacterium]
MGRNISRVFGKEGSRVTIFTALAVAGALAVAACESTGSEHNPTPRPDTTTTDINRNPDQPLPGFSFKPETVKVDVGDRYRTFYEPGDQSGITYENGQAKISYVIAGVLFSEQVGFSCNGSTLTAVSDGWHVDKDPQYGTFDVPPLTTEIPNDPACADGKLNPDDKLTARSLPIDEISYDSYHTPSK